MVEVAVATPDSSRINDLVAELVTAQVPSQIAAQDATLWGPDAESEASIRLAWVSLATTSRPLLAEIEQLRGELEAAGVDHVVLCGMGGSSLAPEVICATVGAPITILDSSDPDQVRSALGDRLRRTVVVVSSKSGGTVETDSQKRAYEKAFRDEGIDPAERIVIVTDPGSPLDESARTAHYRVFNADPHVGGRYSALTAFGLVPSGLAGAPIGQLLTEAASAAEDLLRDEPNNEGLVLGTMLGSAARAGVDKLVLADETGAGLGNWIEQLVAESTGKLGTGILPVVVPSASAPNFAPSTPDSVVVSIGADVVPASTSGYAAAVSGSLGGQMLLWEHATVVAGMLLGINPFDQPDVESAKKAARGMLDGGGATPAPAFTDDGIAAYTHGSWIGSADTMGAAVLSLIEQLDPDTGYLAVQAYLDRERYADFAAVRESLATRLGRVVTFGWGPRFLHSTGQYHKGGPASGVFLQVTGTPESDLEIPGLPFTFADFITAQAIGDAAVLETKGVPVLRLHLDDRASGLRRLEGALR